MTLDQRNFQEAIEKDIAPFAIKKLQNAFLELAERYRDKDHRKKILADQDFFIANPIQRAAYLAYRFPATFAVALRVLDEVTPILNPVSLLDLGAGPGTLTLAALSIFPTLKEVCLMEQDLGWRESAKHLHGLSPTPLAYQQRDFTVEQFSAYDVIGSSYALSELPVAKQKEVVERAWKSAEKAVILIEPGTPYGFAAILEARTLLLKLGASIAAPCPHPLECPLAALGDWCHFSQRLERSKIHKLVKEGELGYEDEKFSYLIAVKVPFTPYKARLVHPTEKHGGHIRLSLCTSQGLLRPTFSKKDGELYKTLRKLEWGDCIKDLNV